MDWIVGPLSFPLLDGHLRSILGRFHDTPIFAHPNVSARSPGGFFFPSWQRDLAREIGFIGRTGGAKQGWSQRTTDHCRGVFFATQVSGRAMRIQSSPASSVGSDEFTTDEEILLSYPAGLAGLPPDQCLVVVPNLGSSIRPPLSASRFGGSSLAALPPFPQLSGRYQGSFLLDW